MYSYTALYLSGFEVIIDTVVNSALKLVQVMSVPQGDSFLHSVQVEPVPLGGL